jgi:arylsulfatase
MKKPNILLITADQLRRDPLGAYGNKKVRTPNIDRLSDEGIRFDNHFIQNPLCMPSRWSIFTGRYPKNHGIRDNGVLFGNNEDTLARVFKANAYNTAAIGKMHLTPRLMCKEEEDENWPDDDFGFDHKCLTDDAKTGEYLKYLKKVDKDTYKYVMDQGISKVKEDLSSKVQRSFDTAPQLKENSIPYELHQSSWIADNTIEYLNQKKESPFFLWCSFVDPHHPFDPPHPYDSVYDIKDIDLPVRRKNEFEDKPYFFKEMYTGYSPGNEKYDLSTITDRGWKTLISKYWGMVSLIDHNIGRIVGKLEDTGLLENTIIIFTSDHGELLGDHGLLFKGPFHYDGLIRVPMIIRPGKSLDIEKEQKEITGFTGHIDLMPTLLDIAGIQIPRGVQGVSFIDSINGNKNEFRDYALVDHDTGDWRLNVKTIRTRDFRMTYYAGKDFGELYDLDKDPYEFVNHWDDGDYKDRKNDLVNRLLDILIDTEDKKNPRVSRY